MKSLKHLQPTNWNIELNNVIYNAEINRKQPTAFIFMIDQSGSMSWQKQMYKGELSSYAEIVADMINNLLNELVGRCTKQAGVRDYFDICVLGYGGQDGTGAFPIWEGNLKDKEWVSVSELRDNAKYITKNVIKKIRGKTKTATIKEPYWFTPVGNYATPMGAAFSKAHEILSKWVKAENHENSYPPVVINITDGAQTDYSDDNLIESSKKVQALNTKDGHVLVLNCHISNEGSPTVFPYSSEDLPDENSYAHRLYEMSSVMPKPFDADISKIRNDADTFSNYRGMAFNANVDVIFNLIDIGTSGATQQLTSNK
jgi:hypothetical protein